MAVFVNKLRSKSIIIKPLPVLVLFPSLSRQNPQFHQSSLSPLSQKQKMETPLITEERINPVLEGGSKGKQYRRRSDAIAFGDRYQKAAALVDLAEDGIGIPEEVLGDARFEWAGKYYFWYIRFNWLWSLNLFALVLLNFLEKQPGVSRLVLVGTKQPRQKPLWCWKDDYSCQERDTFYLGELPYLEKKQAVFYEGITFALLVLQIFAPLAYEGLVLYWKNSMNKLKVGLLFILACDIVVYGSFSSPLPFRLAPYIRVVFLILTSRYLLTCTVTLVGLLGQYLNILALWLLFLIFASWLAYVMFEDTLQGKTIFTSYGTTLYQMFVLFTTSNNPDVWIPAYRQIFRKAINIVGGYILRNSRWSSLFFVLYVLLGVYFVTNLILAVVYDSFKEQFARQIMEMDSMRNRILKKAFNLVDTNNRNYLDKDQCISLFEALNKYRTLPKTSKEDYEFIFDELDRSGDFKINLEEFAELCNAIALKFQKEPAPPFLEKYPAFYRSYPCEKLKSFVRSRYFEYCVALVLLLNLIAVVIETTLDITNSSGQKVWQKIEFFLGWVYVVEMALKIFSLGFDAYWMEGQNKFDFIITWTIFIGETLTFAFPSKLSFLSNGEWIRYLLIARMLRLIRLLLQVKRFRAFVATFLNLIPSLAPYLGMIFCVLCFYCSLGLQLFGGIVNSQNPKLQDTGLYDNDYVLFNFNDYPNGMVTLFNLVVMGNWQVWMESYAELTGTSWTLVYFISFYLVTTLLLLNLILAFVLEAFFAEIDIEKTPEDCGEDTGDTRPSRRRAARARSTMVDRLLHHMFSDELTQCPKP